jgi:metal-dependent amidase/aminoacylase/carboxypeptidase family protein
VGTSSGGSNIIATVTFDDLVGGVREEVVGWRRHLHRNPEVSYHEENTSRFVY